MQKLRFNKTNIENIEAKESRFKIYSDECKGLYVDVFPSGHYMMFINFRCL